MAEPILHPRSKSEGDLDERAVRLMQAGNQDGLHLLLAEHGGTVKCLLQKEFGKMLDALQIDDAVNQASLRAWKSAARFDPSKGSLRSWFYVIARNCARRVLETRLDETGFSYVDDLDAVAPSAAGAAKPPSRFVLDLRRCIDGLSRMQRAVVMADLAAGGTAAAEHLAAELDTTPNSIYVTRTTARKALRRALEALGHMPAPIKRLSQDPEVEGTA